MKEINPQTPEPVSQAYDIYLNTTANNSLIPHNKPKILKHAPLLLYTLNLEIRLPINAILSLTNNKFPSDS